MPHKTGVDCQEEHTVEKPGMYAIQFCASICLDRLKVPRTLTHPTKHIPSDSPLLQFKTGNTQRFQVNQVTCLFLARLLIQGDIKVC